MKLICASVHTVNRAVSHSQRVLARPERVIGTTALAGVAVNCIIGSGIFGLPGMAAAIMGPAAILAYLLCALMIGLVGLCFAEVGSRVNSAGGLYAYALVAFGPIVGGIAGTLMWVANAVVPNAAVSVLLLDTLASYVPALGGGAVRIVTLFAVYGALAAVNIRGARSGARLSTTLVVVKIAPLFVLVIAGLFTLSGPNLHWEQLPPASSLGQTAVLLSFAFIGIEGGLNTSGEVADSARTVPRAILLALTLVATLYIGLQTAAQGVLGPRLAGEGAPLVATAAAIFGGWGATVLSATIALSVTGYLSADILGSPRILHAMAERGQLPAGLSAIHPRLKTPARAIGLYALMCAVVASTGSFRQLVLAGASGTLVVYLICCLGVFPLRSRNVTSGSAPFVAPGGALAPLAASAIIVWMLSTLPVKELGAAASIVAVSGLAYTLQRFGQRASAHRTAVAPSNP